MTTATTRHNDALAASTPATTLQIVTEQKQPKAFKDDTNRYELYARLTGEKPANGLAMGAGVIECVRKFQESAAPGETFNLLDIGMGNGVPLKHVLESIYNVAPDLPVSVTVKEVSSKHIMHALVDNLADIFEKHKNFSLAITNLPTADVPALAFKFSPRPSSKETRFLRTQLNGITAAEFKQEFLSREKNFVSRDFVTSVKNNKAGTESPDYRSVWLISRKDRDQNLESIKPDDFDRKYAFASIVHGWGIARPAQTKADTITPVIESLKPGVGKAYFIQASGGNTCEKILCRAWKKASPFTGYDAIVAATKENIGARSDEFHFEKGPDIHLVTDRISADDAASAIIYAGQLHEDEARKGIENGALDTVEELLAANNHRVTFSNETFICSR